MSKPLGPTGLHRASAHGAGKGGVNKRGYLHHAGWPKEQEDWLKLETAAPATWTFGALRDAFNAAFPGACKTRNAILGKCARLKLEVLHGQASKPKGVPGVRRASRRITLAKQPLLLAPRQTAVSDSRITLRDEGDLAIQGRRQPRKLSTASPADVAELEKRRVGEVIDISAEATEHAKPLLDCTRFECKWPISWSPAMGCGKKAIVGPYCAGHARLAFRVMPTNKRNAKAYGR